MKMRDILSDHPQVVGPEAMICEAARKMRDYDIGMLPVCDGENLIGAVTDRDLTIRGIAEGSDPLKTRVKEVMSMGICCCYEDQDIEEVAHEMEKRQIRRIVVLDRNKKLVGVASLADFALRSNDDSLTEELLECVSQPA